MNYKTFEFILKDYREKLNSQPDDYITSLYELEIDCIMLYLQVRFKNLFYCPNTRVLIEDFLTNKINNIEYIYNTYFNELIEVKNYD